MSSLKLIALCLFLSFTSLLAKTAPSSHFLIRDYFDGFRWYLGPFHFEIKGERIKEISGPLTEKELTKIVSKLAVNKKSFYNFQELDLIPGLIDSHIHLSFEDKSFDSLHDPAIAHMFRANKESLALAHRRLDQAFHRGFLTVRDLGGNPEVLREIAKLVTASPNNYPNFYYIKSAYSSMKGQCPVGVHCKDTFIKLPQTISEINKNFSQNNKRIHHKIFFDNDPYKGVLKKGHVLSVLKTAKNKRSPMAIHTVKQKNFKWLIPYLYPELSLEHLNALQIPTEEQLLSSFLKSKVKLVPSLYSKSFTEVLLSQGKLPKHWKWDRQKQIEKINSLKRLSKLFCFGSDFYYQTFSPLRDPFFYAIEAIRDLERETFLSTSEALSIATGGCNGLFPGSSAGLIRRGSKASFNLVGGNLKSNLKYLHDIQGIVHNGSPYRLP